MAMNVGAGPDGFQSSINITPMIDVLLVLLILFLVIQPTLTKGIDLQVPAEQTAAPGERALDQITLQVRAGADGPTFAINDLEVPPDLLAARIREIYAARPRKVIFVKGEDGVRYADVVRAMDAARAGGIEVIGLVPRPRWAAP
jgi:biopolymer transport protein ExbD